MAADGWEILFAFLVLNMPRAPLFVDFIPVLPERDASAFARLTVFERMGDGRRRWVRDRSVRDLSARQRGIRIDLECDGDQRQNKNDGQGSHHRIVARDLGKIG